MFDNYKTSKYFAKIILDLGEKRGRKFSDLVHALYDEKIVSEEGKFQIYSITSDDLEILLEKIK